MDKWFFSCEQRSPHKRGGYPPITIGPKDLTVVHAVNECIEIKDLVYAAKIYALSALGLCRYQSI